MTVAEIKRFLEDANDDAELVLIGEDGRALQIWECWKADGTPHFTFTEKD